MSEDLQVAVPEEFAQALRDAVATGEYPSLSAALADALAAWSRRHEDRAEELAWLRAGINASLDDPRPSLSSDEVRQHLRELSANAAKRRNAAA